ncbi:MAG: DUF4254 domain-containing protein [Minisyncoccia bacterium]
MEQVIKSCENGYEIIITSDSNIAELIDRLCFVNFRQWNFEDAIRDKSISHEDALILIRKIQSSNSERNQLIEMIDKNYLKKEIIKVSNSRIQVVYHETLGQIIDILSVFYIRKFHLRKMLKSGIINYSNGVSIHEAISAVVQQIVLCEKSFSQLYELYFSGQITLPPFTRLKLYAFNENTPFNNSSKG